MVRAVPPAPEARLPADAHIAAVEVRHETPCCIPGAAGKNSEGGSWVRWLTWIREVKGTRACQESSGRAQAYGREVLRDPRNMVRAGLPEVQSPDDASRHPPERRLNRCRALRQPRSSADATFGVRAMPSEGI